MANSDIKLIYFNIPGRAEVSRLILVLAGKRFEDVRISGLQWLEIKPTTPFGTCPVLVLDGKMYSQSRAIAAYLAKEFGFYGKTNLEGLHIDQIMNLTEDLIQEYGNRYLFQKDETRKTEGAKQLRAEIVPRFLGYYEQLLKENSSGYLVGSSLTVADITLFDVHSGFLGAFVQDSIDNFPLVKQLVKTVGRNERIRAYMDNKKLV